MRLVKFAWLTFWGWLAMVSIRRIGYQGWAPVEVEGQWFLILVPNDVQLPQGEGVFDNVDTVPQGETNEAS